MLVALSELQAGRERLMTFPEIDRRLAPLLRKYTSSKSVHTGYPFWRLQRDGVWEVPNGESLGRRASNSDPLRSELLQKGVRGGFTEAMFTKLRLDGQFRSAFVEAMLRHFPELAHEELLREIGIQ